VSVNQNIGYAWYHSMQVRLEKRFSSGLNASLSYTWSKTMEGSLVPESHRYTAGRGNFRPGSSRIAWL
jgi:hypothetical protein